jgi:serine-type D-Ala-D-Ala carboxypeptidase (penicillin-binding protein 5/6)
MNRIVVAALVFFFMVGSALGGQTSPRKKPAKAPKPKPWKVVAAPASHPQPPFEAYAVVDAADGQILEGQNTHLRWPQASLTKLMLACVIAEKLECGELQLDEPITASKNSQGMGGTQVFLKAGETFSLNELMKAVLIESANDAAYAVAEHVAGRADAFAELMNRKARELGMTDTEFYCVHGLPPLNGGGENITTCSDMILLALEVLKHPQILSWTSIEQTTFRNGTLVISNKNKLLGRQLGVDGLKTGYYRKAGFNIVATGKNGDKRVIVVVLGSPESKVRDRFAMQKFREYLTN